MSDLKPFEHGEEGTHAVCNKHNIGGKSVCCECSGKTDCSNDVNPTPPDRSVETEEKIEIYHLGYDAGWSEGIQQGIAIGTMAFVGLVCAGFIISTIL